MRPRGLRAYGCSPERRDDGAGVERTRPVEYDDSDRDRASSRASGKQALVAFGGCQRGQMIGSRTTALVERNAHGGNDVLRHDRDGTHPGCWTITTRTHDVLACIDGVGGGTDGFEGIFVSDWSGAETTVTKLVHVYINAPSFCVAAPAGHVRYFRGAKLDPFDVNKDGLDDLRVLATFADEKVTPKMSTRFRQLCASAGGKAMSMVKRQRYLRMQTQAPVWLQQPDGSFVPDAKTAPWVAKMNHVR